MRIKYVTIDDCRQYVFAFIHRHLSKEQPAPSYEHETSGMNELEKVLYFTHNRSLYSTFHKKAAYLLCNIGGSHPFSNGNKRLAISILLHFLEINHTNLIKLEHDRNKQRLHEQLNNIFPAAKWKDNKLLKNAHETFLYNLAINIADSTQWGGCNLSEIRERVAAVFKKLYIRN